jgi:hypothetical protein
VVLFLLLLLLLLLLLVLFEKCAYVYFFFKMYALMSPGVWAHEVTAFVGSVRQLREAAYLSGRADDAAAKALLERVMAAYESALDDLVGCACAARRQQVADAHAPPPPPPQLALGGSGLGSAFGGSGLGLAWGASGRASLLKACRGKVAVLLELHRAVRLACGDGAPGPAGPAGPAGPGPGTTTTVHEWPANGGNALRSSSSSSSSSNGSQAWSAPQQLLARLACFRAAHECLGDGSGETAPLWQQAALLEDRALKFRVHLVAEPASSNPLRAAAAGGGLTEVNLGACPPPPRHRAATARVRSAR